VSNWPHRSPNARSALRNTIVLGHARDRSYRHRSPRSGPNGGLG
jgi:hypothetical protein